MSANLTIMSRSQAHRHKRKFAAVLTVEDPDQRRGLRFHSTPHPSHLVIRCADLDYPVTEPYGSRIPGLRLPTQEQVQEAIDFGREHLSNRMLVHCHVGVSRSTAMALAILADRFGVGREGAALAALLDIRNIAVPNRVIVQLADASLGCGGALLRIVDQHTQDNLWCKNRRRDNRIAYMRHYGVPHEYWDIAPI